MTSLSPTLSAQELRDDFHAAISELVDLFHLRVNSPAA